MSTPAAPKRCLDALPASDPLRSSLAAAVRDRPKADFDRVYRGVIAIGGAGVGGGGGGDGGTGDIAGGAGIAASATKVAASGAQVAARAAVGKAGGGLLAGSGVLAKTFAVGLFGAASVGTAWWIGGERDPVYRDEPPRTAAPAPVASTSAAAIVAPPPVAPTAAPSAPPPPAQASAPAKVDEEAEMSLLREAGGVISSDPARALALVDEAERRFARGALAQEREVIRVQALVAAGRRDEALQRARALLARTPASAHRPRLEQILPELVAD